MASAPKIPLPLLSAIFGIVAGGSTIAFVFSTFNLIEAAQVEKEGQSGDSGKGAQPRANKDSGEPVRLVCELANFNASTHGEGKAPVSGQWFDRPVSKSQEVNGAVLRVAIKPSEHNDDSANDRGDSEARFHSPASPETLGESI